MERFTITEETPRHIPLTTSLQVIFGGLTNKIGWPIFGLGMIFFWFFSFKSDLGNLPFFLGKKAIATGRVDQVRETGTIINDQTVEEYFYSFWAADGQLYHGSSFGTDYQYNTGYKVYVEYLTSNPKYSRIQDTRAAEVGIAVGIIPLIIPIIGFTMVLIGLNGGIRAWKLLRFGHKAYGKLARKQPTGRRVNDQVVYKMYFRFTAEDGNSYLALTHTHETHVLEDEESELLLYDPKKPKESWMFDNLPGNPEIDHLGRVKPGGVTAFLGAVFVPALAIICNVVYLVLQ